MSLVRPIAVQVGVIIALGTAIGVADAFYFRPVSLKREAPPEFDPGTKPAPVKTPEPITPAPTTPAPSTPAPAQTPQPTTPTPAAATPATPGTFTPTPKDKLPAGHITLDQAKAGFDAQSAVFVDSRKPELYEAAHIPGAFKIELSDFSKGDPQILMLIPRDSTVIVYCNGGNCDESEKVAQMLNGSGYQKVYVLHDGLPGWQAMGWPTESGKGMQP